MNNRTGRTSISLLRYTIILLISIMHFSFVSAQDAQWRGPNRDGKFADTGLLKEWPADGPELIFVTGGVGKGLSSCVANTERIYTTGVIDSLEYLSCLNLKGEILWQKAYGGSWRGSYPDARCTPTLDGNRVYVLSTMDNMVCFNAGNGEKIWEVDIHKEYDSSWDMFGVSESPLMVDDMIITTPAGKSTTVIALDKMSGELVWKSESINANRSNMSPVAIEHCGKKYVVSGSQTHYLFVDAENGDILWTYQHNFLQNGDNTTILTNTPVYQDSCIWISNGWDVKSVMLEIAPDGKSFKEKFTDQTFDNQNHGVILHEGYLYGSNFTGRQTGKWICMNWKTGEIVWIEDYHNKGPILFADGMLYINDERRGNMALVEPSPKEFNIVSEFRIKEGSGPYWARPSIYNGMLLVRHGDVLISYNIRKD